MILDNLRMSLASTSQLKLEKPLEEWQEWQVLNLVLQALKQELNNFPAGCCEFISSRVESTLGFPKKSGLFVDSSGNGHPHAWNYNPCKDENVDLTASQFDPALREIFITHAGSPEADEIYLDGVGVGF